MTNHALFHTLHQLSRQLTNRLNEALKPFGLYSAQWSVLFALHTKGSLTQKELSEYLFVEAPPMTRTIQRLVKQGYVSQIPGKDKREKYIQLTEEAVQEFPKWEKAVLECNLDLLKNFPEISQNELTNLQSIWLKQLL
ncbi:MarR family transcriptional regulator [Neobacillus niacini]|uniref:MarR family winged helix-turn-helix transcriptional regulator n=1 Tax=Neobacillus niacini TaxID=86668 RepID=UPI00052F4CE8|nr:MarR family transcriptional regulator [Neobacillus niacini]KGM45867.1 MarR family transcriptional regulator [Neobacillus niacini]MEC1525722.1 MarR family transcriptional regulator [Neobacillus niacini]